MLNKIYGGISRELWLLSLTQLINRSGTMVIFFLSVYLKEEIHLDLDRVGNVMAAFGLGTIVGVYTGGRLIDVIGYYRVMLLSLFIGGAFFVAVSFITEFYLLCIGMFLLSAMGEAFRPANLAAMGIYSTPENYTRATALNRLAINLGFAIGPLIGGMLASVSYRWIFWADGISCVLAAFILIFFVRQKKEKTKKTETADPSPLPFRSPLRDKYFMLFLPLVALYAIAFFQFFSTMPLYYKEVAHLSEKQIGILMAVNGLLVAVFEMLIIYKYEKRFKLHQFITTGALMLCASYVMLVFVSGWWWLLIITVIISFSEMFAMPFMNTYMNNRSNASNRGRYASMYIISWSTAQILTPVVATRTIENFGYTSLWIILALSALTAAAGIPWITREKKGTPLNSDALPQAE